MPWFSHQHISLLCPLQDPVHEFQPHHCCRHQNHHPTRIQHVNVNVRRSNLRGGHVLEKKFITCDSLQYRNWFCFFWLQQAGIYFVANCATGKFYKLTGLIIRSVSRSSEKETFFFIITKYPWPPSTRLENTSRKCLATLLNVRSIDSSFLWSKTDMSSLIFCKLYEHLIGLWAYYIQNWDKPWS